jgi:hypothetical protein
MNQILQIINKYQPWNFILIGFILVLAGLWIGATLFGSDTPILNGNMLSYTTNLWTEAISIGITVFILDQINRYRDNKAAEAKEKEQKAVSENAEKQKLIVELRSPYHMIAMNALEQIRERRWYDDGSLKGVYLVEANLQNAFLFEANLEAAVFAKANLKTANLFGANLQKAKLWQTDLEDADLRKTNLKDAFLVDINLRGALIGDTDFEGAILPDAKEIGTDKQGRFVYNKFWTPETDMRRYTDPNHKDENGKFDFWQPEWAKEQQKSNQTESL